MEQLFALASDPRTYLSLLTLSLLEIVLGIDNIIFISIVTGRLPEKFQARARSIGISLALIFRVLLLLSISWIMSLTEPLFALWEFAPTGRDMILLAGGSFLVIKSLKEINELFEDAKGVAHLEEAVEKKKRGRVSFYGVVLQVILVDIVFSFDSVITAVGLVNQIPIMIAAVCISMVVMLLCSGAISRFINKNPSIKMLALAFLVLIGAVLLLEGFHIQFSKTFVYFAMGFSLVVEALNLRMRKLTQEGARASVE